MYENIGQKIMTLAKVLGWIFLIAGAIGCMFCWAEYGFASGIVMLLGGFVGYISTWPLYGFGLLVQKAE